MSEQVNNEGQPPKKPRRRKVQPEQSAQEEKPARRERLKLVAEKLIVVKMPLAARTAQNRRFLALLKEHGCKVANDRKVTYMIGETEYTGQTIITFPPGSERTHHITLQLSDIYLISLPGGLYIKEQCMFDRDVSRIWLDQDKRRPTILNKGT
jgi:hypothetical protein